MEAGPSSGTVDRWKKQLNVETEWLKYEAQEGKVVKIYCVLCTKHETKIRALRNYSKSFIDGIGGSALKKDNVVKHARSDQHMRAISLEKRPATLLDIYKTTAIGRAISKDQEQERERLSKLFEIAYFLAREELPFTKYAPLAALELKHGVKLGQTYMTAPKCKEFTDCIGKAFEKELVSEINDSKYLSILIDGATDTSVIEKELIFVLFVSKEGKPSIRFLRLKNVQNASAEGLKEVVTSAFIELDIDNLSRKLVGFCADGAAVNLGKKKGLSALLKQDKHPWLVTVHCLNHRLELACKDAFKNTYFETVTEMLQSLYYVYQNSPKRMRQLHELATIMEHQKTTKSQWYKMGST